MKLKSEALVDARKRVHHVLDETRALAGCDGVDVMVGGQDPAHLVIIDLERPRRPTPLAIPVRSGPVAVDDFRPTGRRAPNPGGPSQF
jgi:hypothetical protein